MQDVVDIIGTHLHMDICPVYWPCDAAEDIAKLTDATGLSHGVAHTKPGRNESRDSDRGGRVSHHDTTTICSRETFNRLVVSLPQCGKTFTGSRYVWASALRRAVLGEFGGDVVWWLKDTIKRETSVQVPSWYARAFLPLPHERPVATHEIARVWDIIAKDLGESAVNKASVCAILAERRTELLNPSSSQRVTESIIDDMVDCAVTEIVRRRCIAIFCSKKRCTYSNLVWSLKDMSVFHTGAAARARRVAAACLPVHGWVPVNDEAYDICLEYIAVGGTDIHLCDRLRDNRKAALEDKAREMEVDLAQLRRIMVKCKEEYGDEYSNVWEVDDTEDGDDDEHTVATLSRMIDDAHVFATSGMVITRWKEVLRDGGLWPSPRTVTHIASGLTTDNAFIAEHDREFYEDPKELEAMFVRLDELIAELDERGMQKGVGHHSRLCEMFVAHGKYYGPTHCVDTSREPVELVVDMMVEMNFIWKYTAYSIYLSNIRDSEEAKRAAIYTFIYGSPGSPEHTVDMLPPRLKAIYGADGEERLKQAKTNCENADYFGNYCFDF
jgi:hypothetical protein